MLFLFTFFINMIQRTQSPTFSNLNKLVMIKKTTPYNIEVGMSNVTLAFNTIRY